MCQYSEIENLTVSNGKTVKEANIDVKHEIERIYQECWSKGISVPFYDNDGNIYLANPDGSEDKVRLDRKTRTYHVISQVTPAGKGKFAYLV